MLYKYETHLHTTEASACATSPAKDYIQTYINIGYSGIIVTDHFWGGNTCVSRELPWKDWVNNFCLGYDHALEEAELINKKTGRDFKVFFGFEQTFDGDDYLIYGLGKDWLLENPEVVSMNHSQLFENVNNNGGLMIQAHPFRFRGYQRAIHVHPREVHGVEIYNAGNTPEENELAELYAKQYGFRVTSGSDIHHTTFITERTENSMPVGGVAFEHKINTIQDYIDGIKDGKGQFLREKV